MPLLTIANILNILSCPACGNALKGPAESLTCSSEGCRRVYPAVGDGPTPILIDSNISIVDVATLLKADGGSQLKRRSQGWCGRLAARLAVSRNRTAEEYSHRLAADVVAETNGRNARLLIVGGGEIGNGVESLYENDELDLIAFDIYSSERCQIIADGHQIPLLSDSVDGVLIQAVLEHVLRPQQVVDEIHRVLRPGGIVYADTPFMIPVHEGPFDFTRFSESGHRYLFRNFAARSSGVVGGLGTQLHWTLYSFGCGVNLRVGQFLRAGFFWLPVLDRWLDPRATVDGAASVYFYGHSSPVAISPREIIDHYSGGQRRYQS